MEEIRFAAVIAVTIIAAVLGIGFIHRLDPHRKDKGSGRQYLSFFIFGVLSMIPTFLLYERMG